MGAHTRATKDVARQRAEGVITRLREVDNEAAAYWVGELETTLEQGVTRGTLKAWMQAAHGETVRTLQSTIKIVTEDGLRGDVKVEGLWAPGRRQVDASRATRVLLDGSTRDYAGVTTFLVTERAYVGFASWGSDRVHMVVYVR